MKNLFKIVDYVKVNSSDYANEVREMLIHFGKPSKELLYWRRCKDSAIIDMMRKWFWGETFVINDNRLTIEVPRDLDCDEEKGCLVEAVFGEGAAASGVLPLPTTLYDSLDVDVRLIPGSVKWTSGARTATVCFSTTVRLCSRIPRYSLQELENGISCEKGGPWATFRLIQEIVLNSRELDFFRDDYGYQFVILKSLDEKVLRKKFSLQKKRQVEWSKEKLFRIASLFAPQLIPESLRDMPSDNVFATRYEKIRHVFFSSGNLYSIQSRFWHHQEGKSDFLTQAPSLRDTFRSCAKFLDEEIRKKLECGEFGAYTPNRKKNRIIKKQFGKLELELDRFDFDVSDLESLIAELNRLADGLQVCLDFIEQELSDGKLLEDYVYEKILLDPISYTGFDAEPFRDFALSLVS